MRVRALIEAAAVIRTILAHRGVWDSPKRMPQRGRDSPVSAGDEALLAYADSQVSDYHEAYDIPEYLRSHITCGVTAGMVCVDNW